MATSRLALTEARAPVQKKRESTKFRKFKQRTLVCSISVNSPFRTFAFNKCLV